MSLVIFILGVIYFVAHFLAVLFDKTRIPDVLILMILGIIAGPVLHLVHPEDFGQAGQVMVTIALILILFESGTTLDIKVLGKTLGPTLLISILTFVVTVAVIAIASRVFFGLSVMTSLIAGTIMGGTSSAVVIPMVKGLKMESRPSTILIMESALTDVLCIVLTISLLKAAVSNDINSGKIATDILASLGLAALIGVAGGFIWLVLLNMVRKIPNNLFTTFAYVFLVYGFTEFLGFSGAIASLALGITLANNKRSGFTLGKYFKVDGFAMVTQTERLVFSEMVFLLKTFFFLYLGVSLSFKDSKSLFVVLIILLLVYAGRLVLTRLLMSRKSIWKDAAYTSVMIPKGLAAAILAAMPVQAGLEGGHEIQAMAYYLVLTSIVLTAIMVPLMNNVKPVNSFYRAFFKPFSAEHEEAAGDKIQLPDLITEMPENLLEDVTSD
jgi:cell volume regulation protein A